MVAAECPFCWHTFSSGGEDAEKLVMELFMGHVEREHAPKPYPYRWAWKKRLPERTGQPCKLLVVGKLNNVLLEFQDGYKVVTDRRGIRRC